MEKQTTIKSEIRFVGVGVHNGVTSTLVIKPAAEGEGIVVRHANQKGADFNIGSIVPAVAMHATVLESDTWQVSTIEHVMAALAALQIDNAIIELDGDEIPILDGSSQQFVEKISQAGRYTGTHDREYLTPKEVLRFEDLEGKRFIEIHPAAAGDSTLSLDYEADFDHPGVPASRITCTLHGKYFVNEIIPARTFGFLEQLPFLQKHGLAQGASLDNTLVISKGAYVNEPRFEDECVRHKLLDLVGDLYLLGKPLAGKVIARRTGHSFNRQVIEHKLAHPEKWKTFS